MKNQGGIANRLAGTYTQPAAVPPMPWVNSKAPAAPGVSASASGDGTAIRWQPAGGTAKIAVQARTGGSWRTVRIGPAGANGITIPRAEVVAVTAFDRYGNASAPKVLGLK